MQDSRVKFILNAYFYYFSKFTLNFFPPEMSLTNLNESAKSSKPFICHISKQSQGVKLFQSLVLIVFYFFCLQSFRALIQKHNMASFFNLDKVQEFDNYAEHLFGLGGKFVDFCQEESLGEQQNRLETRISSSDKTASETRPEGCSARQAVMDSQFQTSFMNEHIFILQKYIENNKSLFLYQSQLPKPTNCNTQQHQLTEAFAAIKNQIQTFAGTKLQLAITGLYQHDRVVGFLTQILEKFNKNVSHSLLKMAILLWREYSKLNIKNLAERQIIQFSSRLLSSSFYRKLRGLVPCSKQSVDFVKLKGFINVFVNTFLFVAFEYFVNPYYQLQQELLVKDYQSLQLFLYDTTLNDQDEDDEEYEAINGRKLVKLTSFAQFE